MLSAPTTTDLGRYAAAPPRRTRWWVLAITVPGLMWACLWLAVSAHPWSLTQTPRGLLATVHWARALAPLLVLGLGIVILMRRSLLAHGVARLPHALRPWLWYGLLAAVGALMSPDPSFALWWAACYLAVLVAAWVYIDAPTPLERLDRARSLNLWSWAFAGGLLLVLLYITRGVLVVEGSDGTSGYGISNRVRSFGGVTMVRASGFARAAAIPALFGFVLAWQSHGLRRIVWGAVSLSCGVLVVYMQSRGATLSLVGGIGFALLFMGRRSRMVGILLFVALIVVVVSGSKLGFDTESAREFLNRERYGPRRDITSGRAGDWLIAWNKILESPFLGWGPQADRHFITRHVHNTVLYAGLAAGLIGSFFVLLGLWRAWRDLLRGARARMGEAVGQPATFVQVGCLLAFFTLRGIPEVSGAMFGVDVLLMVPAMAWLSTLEEIRRDGLLSDDEAMAREPRS